MLIYIRLEIKKNIWGLIEGLRGVAKGELAAKVATETFAGSLKSLTVAWFSSPWGMATLAVAVFFAITDVKGVEYYYKRAKANI